MNSKPMFKVNSNKTTIKPTFFYSETAPESYWHIMAEHYRVKLEDVTRENQQVINLQCIPSLNNYSFHLSFMKLLMD
jgi:hypothetical protein